MEQTDGQTDGHGTVTQTLWPTMRAVSITDLGDSGPTDDDAASSSECPESGDVRRCRCVDEEPRPSKDWPLPPPERSIRLEGLLRSGFGVLLLPETSRWLVGGLSLLPE